MAENNKALPKDGREYLIVAINFGSTSTKVGAYRGNEELFRETVRYEPAELASYGDIFNQGALRRDGILAALEQHGIELNQVDVIVSRGSIVKPIASGVYRINDAMLADARRIGGYHPCSLGVHVARELADAAGIGCYTVDPPTVDELTDVARVSGMPGIERESLYQPLNHKRTARKWAREHNTTYEQSRLVVAHMGGGTTVAAHELGRAIDVNNGTLGDGPMTPERPGSLPLVPVIERCFSGEMTREQMLRLVYHGSGVAAYLGTADMVEVERRALGGDAEAKLVLDAFCYQVAKEIGAMVAVLCGRCDAILLTGGIAYSDYVCKSIERRVGAFAPVCVYPGEDELGALVDGVLGYLRGETELLEYE